MYCRAVARRVPRLNLDSTWSFSFQPSSSRMPFLVFFPRKKNICEGNTTIKIPASLITRLDPNIWGQFRPWTWHLSGSAGFQLCQVSGIWWPGLQVASLKLMQFFFVANSSIQNGESEKAFWATKKNKTSKTLWPKPKPLRIHKTGIRPTFYFSQWPKCRCPVNEKIILQNYPYTKHHDKTMQP